MTPLEVWSIRRTGEDSTTRPSSCAAIVSAISCEPPMKRDCWAPWRVSKFRSNVPGFVSLANRNYMNLLEMPVLFYVICLMLFVSGEVDQTFLYLAWGYVGLRVLHSLVHVTYNNVLQRLTLFAASNVVVTLMWGLFFYERFTAA